MKELDWYEIKCPYCGYEFSDSEEKIEKGVLECPHCGDMFEYKRNVKVTYTMKAIEQDEDL